MVLLIIKILDSNKLLTRLSIILTAKIKAGKNSNKLKNEIIQTVYLLYQQNKQNKKFKSLNKNLIKSPKE